MVSLLVVIAAAEQGIEEQIADPAVSEILGRRRVDNGDGTWSFVSEGGWSTALSA